MDEIAHLLPDMSAGAYGIWLVAGMLLVKFMAEYRLMRGLTPEDRLARRDGYQKQVEILLEENRKLRLEMHQMNEHHEGYRQLCHAENDQLRQMLSTNADETEGLKRKIADLSMQIATLKGFDVAL
jgi:predicted nuclease with TOPRIM domain